MVNTRKGPERANAICDRSAVRYGAVPHRTVRYGTVTVPNVPHRTTNHLLENTNVQKTIQYLVTLYFHIIRAIVLVDK
jgi:hypothetical protein